MEDRSRLAIYQADPEERVLLLIELEVCPFASSWSKEVETQQCTLLINISPSIMDYILYRGKWQA
jgi:hypothetical protein